MARLPQPGSDNNVWGDVLNQFLLVEHEANGSLRQSGSIAGKANNSEVVHLAGTETITGSKTFTGSISIPASSLPQSAVGGLTAALAARVPTSLASAKGDMLAATGAGTFSSVVVGVDGMVLVADSGQANGVAWGPVPAPADVLRVTGLYADGVQDDGPVIQAVLDTLTSPTSNHSFEVLVEAPPDGTLFINSTVQISTNYTTLRFGSSVVYGANGRCNIQGELVESPATGKPFLMANAIAGTFNMTLNNAAIFAPGDYVVIRGARDATGNPAVDQKEYHTIASVIGNVITLTDPLEETFLAYNPNPDAPVGTSHESQVTRVINTLMTVAANRGDRIITVADTSIFTVGDYVHISDNTHTHKPDGSPELGNYKHREVAEVKEIVSATQVRLSHALYHSYDLAETAMISLMNPVFHSTIKDASVTWSAMAVVGNAFEIKYGVHCSIERCDVRGNATGTASWKNQAFRQTDSFMCEVRACYAANPSLTGSGNGYGATLYGATQCMVTHCRFASLRHSVLLFNGASGNIVSNCISEDCCISDYDLHGAECTDNLITHCVAIGGDSAAMDGSVNKTACKAGNTAHADGDFRNIFSNILVVNYGGVAFEVVPSSSDTVFRDSQVTTAQTGIKIVALTGNTSLTASETLVQNVQFSDLSIGLCNINGNSGTSMVHGLTIQNCHIARPTTSISISYAQRVYIWENAWMSPTFAAQTYAIQAVGVQQFSIARNDFSKGARGIKLTDCPSARVYENSFYDLTETVVYEGVGGNTDTVFAHNKIYGYDPTVTISGSGPSIGGIIDIYDPYVSDNPKRHTYKEWNFDPISISSGSGSVAISGSLYVMKLSAQSGGQIQNIITTIGSGTTPAGLVAGQNYAAIFDANGTRIGITADQSAVWASTGLKTMALTAPITIQGGKDYYVVLLANAATLPSFVAASGAATTSANAGQSNTLQRFSVNGTGLTAVPASLVLASNSGTGAKAYWIALS
jgi:Right handed beta helix region/Lower baseplate protein N-terminal domain